jgi:hypothetical protein
MRGRLVGAWRNIPAGSVFRGGQWRRLTRAVAFINNQWRQVVTFTPPLTVSITPGGVAAQITGAGTAVTNTATAIPAGGVAPFSYSWSRISGASAFIASPGSSATTFVRELTANEFESTVFQCLVTDGTGATATATVTATFFSFTFD